jgi:hypothetical protein
MTRLFIDDIREPYEDDFAVVRSYSEAVGYMRSNGCPTFVTFDHDLGDSSELSGYDIAKWMVNRDMNADGKFMPADFNFNVHSANPPGAANIRGLLDQYLEMRDAE